MEEDRDDVIDKLFADARKSAAYDSKREYGFETRVMAKLRAERQQQRPFQFWAWRLIPAFCSIVLALGVWTYAGAKNMMDLNALTSGGEEKMLVAYLTGE
jgi:anti-sigma factor RsiW